MIKVNHILNRQIKNYTNNARYTVDSNELFIVNSLAEGIARGGVQTASNTEYSITARRTQVSLYVDWLNISNL